MTFAFWVALGVIAYTYAGYPLIISLLARLRARPWRSEPIAPSVSVVMAVHNGAAMLPAQIDHLASLDPSLVREVIVVSDGSSDGTEQILANLKKDRFTPVVLEKQEGKAAALNAGVARATGEILLFIDIRPRLANDALTLLVSNFADPTVGCVAGELLLNTAGHDATASAVSGVYWKYEQAIRNCEATFDSPVGVYGGFYAVRRALYTPFPAGIILDDMFQPLAIIRQGYRSVLDRRAFVMDTWPAQIANEFQRKVRTLAGNYQLFSLAPWILSPFSRVWFQLVSHKLLRLVVPYLFIVTLVSAAWLGTVSMGWRIVGLAQAIFWIAALLSTKMRLPGIGRFASAAGALLVLNAAAVVGLYKFLFTTGPLWKIWSAPSTATRNSLTLEARRGRA